jgi:hypothetical protein
VSAEPTILPTARRHGIDDEDILHAWRTVMEVWELDEGLTMLIGSTRSGRILEIALLRATTVRR